MFHTGFLPIIRSLVLYTQKYIQVMLLTALLASSQHDLYDIDVWLCVQ